MRSHRQPKNPNMRGQTRISAFPLMTELPLCRCQPEPNSNLLMRIPRSVWLSGLATLCTAVLSGFGATHTVNVGPGSSFSPSSITINVGDTVSWPNVTSFHTVTGYAPPSEPFCGGSPPPGGACSVTFQVAGTYN